MSVRVILAGCSHKTAPVALRERLSLYGRSAGEMIHAVRDAAHLAECAVVSTCNRTEVYGVAGEGDWEEEILDYLARLSGERPASLQAHLYFNEGSTAVRHLFTVASGLDSMVPGEGQILGQVREALREADQAGAAGTFIRALFESALACGKRARTETQIGRGAVSVSLAAVQLAQQIFENLRGHTVALFGAGETAETTARIFSELPGRPSLLVCNRSGDRAADLGSRLGAEVQSWEDRRRVLVRADVVIASTGAPEPVISAADVAEAMRKRRGKPLFLIDIAVPRDVEAEVARLDDVYLYNIDDLQGIIQENLSLRHGEAARAAELVDEEVLKFQSWVRGLEVGPTIRKLQEFGSDVVSSEWQRVGTRLSHLPERDREVIQTLLTGVVNKLMRPPILHLKDAAASGNGYEEVEQIRAIFGLTEPEASDPDAS